MWLSRAIDGDAFTSISHGLSLRDMKIKHINAYARHVSDWKRTSCGMGQICAGGDSARALFSELRIFNFWSAFPGLLVLLVIGLS